MMMTYDLTAELASKSRIHSAHWPSQVGKNGQGQSGGDRGYSLRLLVPRRGPSLTSHNIIQRSKDPSAPEWGTLAVPLADPGRTL